MYLNLIQIYNIYYKYYFSLVINNEKRENLTIMNFFFCSKKKRMKLWTQYLKIHGKYLMTFKAFWNLIYFLNNLNIKLERIFKGRKNL